MKVYSWKIFLITVLLGSLVFAYCLYAFDDIYDLFTIGLWCYMIFLGLRASLTKDGYEAAQKSIKEAKKLRLKMLDKYGKFAYVLIYTPFLVLIFGTILSIILAFVLPNKTGIVTITLIATFALHFIFRLIFYHFEEKDKTE